MDNTPGNPVRLVVPSALQMSWAEIPAYFYAATETGRDLIQQSIKRKVDLPHHVFKEYILLVKKTKWSIN